MLLTCASLSFSFVYDICLRVWVRCLLHSCAAGTFSLVSTWFPFFHVLTDVVKGQMDRWVFTEEHVAMLEASFLKNPYVSSADKASFSQIIGCSEDKVYMSRLCCWYYVVESKMDV